MAVNVAANYASPYKLQFKTPAELLTQGFDTSCTHEYYSDCFDHTLRIVF